MRLHTPRLLLREFEAEDWEAVQEYAGDPTAVSFRLFGPCTDEETRTLIQALTRQVHPFPRTLYDLAIVRTADNRLIGGCDIGLLADNSSEAAMGYGLNRAYWGQGYMTEAAAALLAFGFAEWNIERFRADVEPDNIASARVLEKVGMCRVGQGQQWIKGEQRVVWHYAITAEECEREQEMSCRAISTNASL